ncbi:MAG: SDR family oxidoreductase [Chitinophagaceae bacterium]
MKKILITGANGLLGQHLVSLLLKQGYNVIAVGKGASRLPFTGSADFTYYNVDITDDSLVQGLMEKEAPHTVVHAAAITQVDDCQLNQENCEAVNVRATAQLLLSAESICRHFIYISTDFVFDGEQGDYKEEDAMNPVSWYGFTKVQAEGIVETSEIPFAIVRTCLVYGNVLNGTRSNIINWVRSSLAAGKSIHVVNDQWRTPTYVEDLARGILLVIEKNATGAFHISGKDKLTPYEMAVQTATFCQLDTALIVKEDASSFSQPAKRPPKTGFDISKARRDLGFEPISFNEGLRKMLGTENQQIGTVN